MPIHNFKCKNCLNYWEEIWTFKEYSEKIKEVNEHIKICPECKSLDISKCINQIGIKFKGKSGTSGFYTLDYALPEKKIKENKK